MIYWERDYRLNEQKKAGKTTTAAAMSAGFTAKGYKVLAIDL